MCPTCRTSLNNTLPNTANGGREDDGDDVVGEGHGRGDSERANNRRGTNAR